MDRWIPKGGPPPPQSDGAFERFLTAAIATIITIMFSWRLLDKINDEDREDERMAEEWRRPSGASSSASGGERGKQTTPVNASDFDGGKLDALNQRVLALTETLGRSRAVGGGGVGYQTTTLKPIIRIPVDIPLDGDEDVESPEEIIYRPVWETTIAHEKSRFRCEEGAPTTMEPGDSTADHKTDRLMSERQDSSFDSNTIADEVASSTETLLLQRSLSQPGSEPCHSSSETEHFVDSSGEDLGGDGPPTYQHHQLNVSTDSSSGGANSSKEEYRHILDDENYRPYRDGYRNSEDRHYDDRDDSDDDFMGFSEDLDTDYAHDDIQPRELDSDEELFCCSTLEPIIEEDSDEMTTSSSESTNSSRSGKAFYESRHREHEYDLEYEERKHGLSSERRRFPNRFRGRTDDDLDSAQSSTTRNAMPPLLHTRPSTAVPSRRPVASHLLGSTPRDLERSRLNGVNTGFATDPDNRGDTARGDDYYDAQALERYGVGGSESRPVLDPLFKETDLDASDPEEDSSNFPSEEEYVKYVRSYGSSVDRLTGKLKSTVTNAKPSLFPHSQAPIDTRQTFPSSRAGQIADQVVPDKFVRTSAVKSEVEDSASESDESVQTVITRQASAESGDSPVHGPTLLALRPNPVKTKRPLSDGAAYGNKKLKGEEDKEEAYFRDRYVSEGGGVPFGEEEEDNGDAYGNENDNKQDLKAYKSYAALDSEGLGSPVQIKSAFSNIFEIDETNSQARDLNPNQGEFTVPESINTEDTIFSPETQSSDSNNVPSVEVKLPGVVNSPFRQDNETKAMDRSGYSTRTEESGDGKRSEQGDESEEWEEQIIEETFVVPLTPERAILKTLQSVKELLDQRSEIRRRQMLGMDVVTSSEPMEEECQSTCTSTMIEVDGYGAAGFETYEFIEEDAGEEFPEESNALVRPATNVDTKSKLGFQLNLDEYKTNEYTTESGWPIVRYIEKERVFVEEDGHDDHEVPVAVVDTSDQRADEAPSEEETNIDDVEEEESYSDQRSKERTGESEESEEDGDDDDESDDESDEESSGDKSADDQKDKAEDKADGKKDEKFAFVECKDENLVAPFATLETPIRDKRSHSQRIYLEEERYSKLEFGEVKLPSFTRTPFADLKLPSPIAPQSATSENYKPSVKADMRALSPPPIEMLTPSQPSSKLKFTPEVITSPSPNIPKREETASASVADSNKLKLHSTSGFEPEKRKLIDSEEPYEPFDDFNSFLSGIPASSEPFSEEDYDSFVRQIAEKDDDEIFELDTLKTPLSAAGILSGNLASPFKKQEVFSFESKEQVRPVPLARKHSLKEKKPESQNVEDATGESEVKKAKLKRTSTAQSEEDFGVGRRASVGSTGDEESMGALNRSFEETSSRSFAIERYDSEPGVSRSLSRESLMRSISREGVDSPTHDFKTLLESPLRPLIPPRPSSGVSQEPVLDVVFEVPVPPYDSSRSQSSSSAEPTTPATPLTPAKVESSPNSVTRPQSISKTPNIPAGEIRTLTPVAQLETSPLVKPPVTKLESSPVVKPPTVTKVDSSPVVKPPTVTKGESSPVVKPPTVTKLESSPVVKPPTVTKLESSPVVKPPTVIKVESSPMAKPPIPTKPKFSSVVLTPPVNKLESSSTVQSPQVPKLESSPAVKPPTVAKSEEGSAVLPPPVKWTRVIPGSNFVEEKLSPNTSTNVSEEILKKLPDTPERKLIASMDNPELERPDVMDLEFADADEDGPELFSPSMSIDRFETKIEEIPKVRPVLENNVLNFSTNKTVSEEKEETESGETEEEGSEDSEMTDSSSEEESDDEESNDRMSEKDKSNVDKNDNLVVEDEVMEMLVDKLTEERAEEKVLSHSAESIDDVMPQDSTSVSATTSPGVVSSDSAESPVRSAKSLSLPLSVPFRGTAWAHAQFGQAPAKPRSMKEIKKKFKPYKSVLTQQPPTTPTTPPSPKITPFVLPDHLITPSRIKIVQSRNRFLSEQNLNSDPLASEFEARKEALQNAGTTKTAPSTPLKERKYTPKSLASSSKYRSQEQLEKIKNMINLTRKSESNLHTAHLNCLHSDCIFTEKGRREIMDKALSIDSIHSELYSQLQQLNSRDYLDNSGMGDAFFPETNSDLFDLTFPFQDDRRQVLDRPASMSELRHASDYTTISGSGSGFYETPTSKSGKNRFANRQYKKSKSLCTLETNIDDDHFATSPTEDGLQRVPSVHELRISKSLQKLNVPDWYKQSSLSKSGSCLLKYGSSSTMSSWQMSPSLISSPCTTPSTMSNVVIKTRVQPPTSARNLRSPRYPSKSAPTTPLFDNQSFDNASKPTTPTPVKLPSEQQRNKEKPKSLMPIPIVPFDKIRAMFEKKKENAQPSKQAESPASPASPTSKSQAPSQDKSLAPLKINIKAEEEEDLYDDVVPKVIVSPSDPNVKSILKRPGLEKEKRYSDIVESPEPDEEPIILRPVPTRPTDASPTVTAPLLVTKPLQVEPSVEVTSTSNKVETTPKPPLTDVSKPAPLEKPALRPKPIPPPRPNSSEIKPKVEIPVKKIEEIREKQKSPVHTKATEQKDVNPIAKPKGFSFFKSLRSSSSSSSEDLKNRKSPISPSKNLSPDSSYDSDKFPASPAIRVSPTDRKSPPSVVVSQEPVSDPRPSPASQPLTQNSVIPKAETQRTISPESIQETNIDDSFEDSAPASQESFSKRAQSPAQAPEAEKKRSWFPKARLSKSKSPTEPEKALPKTKPKVSELQSKFEVPEFAQEPRRLTSSRTPSIHNESFTSNASEDHRQAAVESRSPVRETDLDRSLDLKSPRSSARDRDVGLDSSESKGKPSDSDTSFTRDSDKRSSDRGSRISSADKGVALESDRKRDSSFSSRDDSRDTIDRDSFLRDSDRGDRDYNRKEDRRDRDYDRRDSDRRDRDYDRREKDRDRDYDRRDSDRRDRDYDRRDSDRRDRDYDRRDSDRRDRDYDRRDSDRRDRDYDRRDSDRRDRDYDRDRDRDYDKRDRSYDSRGREYDRGQQDRDSLDRRRGYEKQDDSRKEREWSPRDRRQDLDKANSSRASSRDLDTSRDSRAGLRRPSDNEDAPKLRVGASQESLRSAGRTWQPKPRGSRSSVSPQARDVSPTKPVESNGTSSKQSPHRYPVPGSAFSSTKPNTAAGLNTPPLSRHDVKTQETAKSLKETTV
ncbi:uncharacterized protein LOC106071799 [Biomphalaria glabrata]|uniref:Uncharacterized protein LOC106071799 n=1 Tax=Biomphalaria glabrata TaxID=6526 RepID=A0A9W3BES5_BIOGL|nr:uncharacterized protein LOC106071799 [Biomphalaria glabrata]XP_055897940.1 uncharacterized protein LOC106071799 [Biomphalaria glabrata]XP_055897942.1 uncharacterized protein LOC106071799 [Biomphalaria glabrata]XP_055897943.1 uncharacterized protein LOC106071799 [Biomphalaria glabrata]